MPNPFSTQNDGNWKLPQDIIPQTFGHMGRAQVAATTDTVTIPKETAESLKALLLSMADTFSEHDMPDIAIQANEVAALL